MRSRKRLIVSESYLWFNLILNWLLFWRANSKPLDVQNMHRIMLLICSYSCLQWPSRKQQIMRLFWIPLLSFYQSKQQMSVVPTISAPILAIFEYGFMLNTFSPNISWWTTHNFARVLFFSHSFHLSELFLAGCGFLLDIRLETHYNKCETRSNCQPLRVWPLHHSLRGVWSPCCRVDQPVRVGSPQLSTAVLQTSWACRPTFCWSSRLRSSWGWSSPVHPRCCASSLSSECSWRIRRTNPRNRFQFAKRVQSQILTETHWKKIWFISGFKSETNVQTNYNCQ